MWADHLQEFKRSAVECADQTFQLSSSVVRRGFHLAELADSTSLSLDGSSSLSLQVAEARLCSSQSVLERLGAPQERPGAPRERPGTSRLRRILYRRDNDGRGGLGGGGGAGKIMKKR